MNTLKEILFDHHQHWETFKRTYGERVRPNVIKEVEKFRESEEWSSLLSEDMRQVNHRHVLLTIDEDLRAIFLNHQKI